jgi:ABC-type uncharacterized transport system substrate-binding protein
LEGAFANFAKQQADAVLIATDTLFRNQVDQLGALAVRHKLPMICSWRDCATEGGLMSYGANIDNDDVGRTHAEKKAVTAQAAGATSSRKSLL